MILRSVLVVDVGWIKDNQDHVSCFDICHFCALSVVLASFSQISFTRNGRRWRSALGLCCLRVAFADAASAGLKMARTSCTWSAVGAVAVLSRIWNVMSEFTEREATKRPVQKYWKMKLLPCARRIIWQPEGWFQRKYLRETCSILKAGSQNWYLPWRSLTTVTPRRWQVLFLSFFKVVTQFGWNISSTNDTFFFDPSGWWLRCVFAWCLMVLLHSALDLVSGSFVLGLSFLVFAGVCSVMFPWIAPHEAMRDSVPNADWKQAFILCQPRPKRKSDLSVKKHGVFLLTWAEVRFESVGWRVQPDIKGAGIFLEASEGRIPTLKETKLFTSFHGWIWAFKQLVSDSAVISPGLRPGTAKFISFARLQFTAAMHAPCLAVHELRVKIRVEKPWIPWCWGGHWCWISCKFQPERWEGRFGESHKRSA